MSVNGTNNLRTIEIPGGALWTGPQPDAEISNNVEMIILNALGKMGQTGTSLKPRKLMRRGMCLGEHKPSIYNSQN